MSACSRPVRHVALLALLTIVSTVAVAVVAPRTAAAALTDYLEMSDGRSSPWRR